MEDLPSEPNYHQLVRLHKTDSDGSMLVDNGKTGSYTCYLWNDEQTVLATVVQKFCRLLYNQVLHYIPCAPMECMNVELVCMVG